VRIFVSAALNEYDFFDIVEFIGQVLQGLGEYAAVDGIERWEIRNCHRCRKDQGTQ